MTSHDVAPSPAHTPAVEQQQSWFRRPPALVPGTVVVCFLVATGRWGSHLGWWEQGIYLTDVGLAVTAVWALVRHLPHLTWSRRLGLLLVLPAVAIPTWALVRMSMNTQFDMMALRDMAPFVYVSVALLGMVTVDRVARRRTLVALQGALILHAAWVTAALNVNLPTYYLSGGLLRVFEIRADFDAAMLAVLAGVAVHEAVRARRTWQRALAVALALWPTYILFQTGSRAGALALLAAMTITGISLVRGLALSRRQLLAGGALLLLLVTIALPRTSLYGRLTGDPAYAINSAAGTTSAREEAWAHVFRYVSESPMRVAFGVGPGPDFLVDAGARPFFGQVHQGDIRVPHNVLLTYYARLGLIGVGLFLALLVSWVRACWELVIARRPDHLDLVHVLLTATLLLASLVGVILESPFGAVTFFWALGQLVATWINGRPAAQDQDASASQAGQGGARTP